MASAARKQTPILAEEAEVSLPPNPTKAEFRKAFARRLNALLAQKNWTQADLMRATEIPRDMISKYCLGRVLPTAGNVKKIADALGVPVAKLRPELVDATLAPGAAGAPLSMLPSPSAEGLFRLTVNLDLPFDVAMQIMNLLAPFATEAAAAQFRAQAAPAGGSD